MRRLLGDMYVDELNMHESAVALLKLIQHGNHDSASQIELAEALAASESNLCSIIEKLHRDDFLYRERCAVDRRKTRLRLTSAGSDCIEKINALDRRLESELLDLLPENDHLNLFPALKHLTQVTEVCRQKMKQARRAA